MGRIPALLALEVEADGTTLRMDLRQLIRKVSAENPTWGEERIANELKLKLGIQVSPRTVEKYLRNGGPARSHDPKQRWLSFVHNHSKVPKPASIKASPVGANGKLHISTEDGDVVVVKMVEEFGVLATNTL